MSKEIICDHDGYYPEYGIVVSSRFDTEQDNTMPQPESAAIILEKRLKDIYQQRNRLVVENAMIFR